MKMSLSSRRPLEIEWYPGKCLTQKILKNKPKDGSKNTKPITKTWIVRVSSTFAFHLEVLDDEDLDDDMAKWSTTMISDQQLKTKSSRMLSCFTGEAVEADNLEMDDDDDEIDEDNVEEDEEDVFLLPFGL